MKTFLTKLSAAAALLFLASCIAVDPSMMGPGPGGGFGGPSYGGPSYRNPGYGQGSYGHDFHNDHGPAYGSHGTYQGQDHEDRHHMQHNDRRWGGPDAWYASGRTLGQRDRKARLSCNYSRHRNHYDGNTREEFAHGYNDGYHGH
jgi:hypothetical protein